MSPGHGAQTDEPGAEGFNAPDHQGMVHVRMAAFALRADHPGLQGGIQFTPEGGAVRFTIEESAGTKEGELNPP